MENTELVVAHARAVLAVKHGEVDFNIGEPSFLGGWNHYDTALPIMPGDTGF